MPSSWSNLSVIATPLIFRKFPFCRNSLISPACSVFTKIFTPMVSVRSVIVKIRMVFSIFAISRSSKFNTFPRMITSPISSVIFSMGKGSPSKSLPKITSGLSERLSGRKASLSCFLPPPAPCARLLSPAPPVKLSIAVRLAFPSLVTPPFPGAPPALSAAPD